MTRQSLESEIDELILELSEKNIAQKDWESFKAALLKTVDLYVKKEAEWAKIEGQYEEARKAYNQITNRSSLRVNNHLIKRIDMLQKRLALRQQVKEKQ